MKSKISPNLVSFNTIRRGDWLMKISIYNKKFVMVIAQQVFYKNSIIIKNFSDQDAAANFIEQLAKDET